MPLLLPVPLAPPVVLGEVVLGEVELGELVEPLADEEPLAAPCSRRQRSFSVPVRLSHCVLLPLSDGDVVALPLALGDVESLAEEPVLPEPPMFCDDDCAIAAAESAKSAAAVAIESAFSMFASPV